MNFTNTDRKADRVYGLMDYRMYYLVRDQAHFVYAMVNVQVNWHVGDQIFKIRNTIKQEIK